MRRILHDHGPTVGVTRLRSVEVLHYSTAKESPPNPKEPRPRCSSAGLVEGYGWRTHHAGFRPRLVAHGATPRREGQQEVG